MNVNWQISAGSERVELTDGVGEATFTVHNPGPVDASAILQIEPSEKAKSSWFTLAEPRRTVPHGGSVTFTARVAPDEDAQPGGHWLAGRVYSADAAPEEGSVLSNRVSFEIPGGGDGNGGRLWLWILLGALLVVAAVGVVLFLLLRGPDTVPVPDVVGKTAGEASEMLARSEFTVRLENERSADVAAGLVMRQKPGAGVEVEQPAEVTIVVSTGREQVAVPAVAGLTATQAIVRVQNAGLVATVGTQSSPTVPKDQVITVNPEAGTNVDEGSTVALIVSTGPKITLPEICLTRPWLCEVTVPQLPPFPTFRVPDIPFP